MQRVTGKIAVVTGAAAGVGRSTALLLAREGARVVLTDLNEDAGRALAAEIGEQALFVRHDIAEEEDWRTVMSAADERFGAINVLVNNAGVCVSASIEDTSLELWRRLHRINADGVFLGCKYGLEAMKRAGAGSIVNMSSTAALGGMSSLAAYSGSKGSVTALTRSVAAHCKFSGYRIRCNSVHPGGIATAMTEDIRATIEGAAASFNTDPRSGFCDPEDVADLVLFLASDESRFINGVELRVDNALLSACI